MARNGSGTAAKAVSDFVAGNNISASDMNTLIDDIIDMLTQSISKDGQTTVTGSLSFNGSDATNGRLIDVDTTGITFSGQLARLRNNTSGSSLSNPLVEIINDNALATGDSLMTLQQDAAEYTLELLGNANATCAYIDSAATTNPIIDIPNPALTTSYVIQVDNANSLSGGGFLYFKSASSNTGNRSLINVINDNASANSTTIMRMQQDADHSFLSFNGLTANNTTSAISTLTTSGATTHHVQIDIGGTKAWVAASTNNPS